MSKALDKILNLLQERFKDGLGFCFQIQTPKNGGQQFNLCLIGGPGKEKYFDARSIEELSKKLGLEVDGIFEENDEDLL